MTGKNDASNAGPKHDGRNEPVEKGRGNSPGLWELVRRWAKRMGRGGGVLLVAAAAFLAGYLASRRSARKNKVVHAHQGSKKARIWTCSMHPQIRKAGPGKCPICGMDLIPVKDASPDTTSGSKELHMSPRARKLAEIEVTPVMRRQAAAAVRVSGKVAYDERRIKYITSWVSGRIDRLYVRFTGVRVRRGQRLVYIYSPELLTTQMELIQAARLKAELKKQEVLGTGPGDPSVLAAARHKLSLLGLSKGQIASIEARGKPLDHMVLHAPAAGIVIQKSALEGMYVKPGTRLYTIADLGRVWVKLDLYEMDLGRVRIGQTLLFTVESLPGHAFEGKVEFIDPFVDDRTRTVKVRLTVANKDLRLKPEMLVRAVLMSPVGADGKVLSSNAPPSEAPLLIPASAPLITGKRAVVYVERKPGIYKGREILLGPRVGSFYVVRSGLEENEKVVTNGSFKIDASLQILGRSSMMNPASTDPKASPKPVTVRTPIAFKAALAEAVRAYYEIHHGLSRDREATVKPAARRLLTALERVPGALLVGERRREWKDRLNGLAEAGKALAESRGIEPARRRFDSLSNRLIAAIERYGLPEGFGAVQIHCPMAFGNRGADWVQEREEVENPYFGSKMFRCGEKTRGLSKGRSRPQKPR